MNEYGSYAPSKGDRIEVRRTPGNHGPVGIMTGVVLGVITLTDIGEVMDFRADNGEGRVLLATNAQMAAMGKAQTVKRIDGES